MNLIEILLNNPNLKKLINLISGRDAYIAGAVKEFKPFLIAFIYSVIKKPLALVLSDEKEIEEFKKALAFYANLFRERDLILLTFPSYDRDLFIPVKTHENIIWERIKTLWHLNYSKKFILLLPIMSVMRKLIPPDVFRKACYCIKKGEEVPYELFLKILEDNGYRLREEVYTYGEYSVRGGIIDVYSPAHSNPIRIQFFGDTIEQIRSFDAKSQISIQEIDEFIILPCREFIITNSIKNKLKKILDENGVRLDKEKSALIEQLWEEGSFAGYEDYIPLFFDDLVSVFNYLPSDCIRIADEPAFIRGEIKNFLNKLKETEDKYKNRQILDFPINNLFLASDEIDEKFNSFNGFFSDIEEGKLTLEESLISINSKASTKFEGNIYSLAKELKENYKNKLNSFLVFSRIEKAKRLTEALREEEIGLVDYYSIDFERESLEGRIIKIEGDLPKGFVSYDIGLGFYSEGNIYGEYRSLDKKYEITTEIFHGDLQDLSVGDLVVHINHGIGIFRGLNYLNIDGRNKEVMTIEYADGDLLYVPVESLNLVQKYIGSGDTIPTLDKLGGRTWQLKQQKAKKAIETMVKELVELYAYRQSMKGIRFLPDDEFQREFESLFEYEETPDQLLCTEEIKKDMESDKLMERLLCGDVGYGKTEVAMRAAFKAVISGKQVAVLSPTTILAFQHYQTFKKRFEQFPVRIAMVSRLTAQNKLKDILQDISLGKIDIVIGTHRLLSKDVIFADLGLLIIDEEQRFGVLQKERIKELYKNIDVLMLTATPIPRTLQMALMGIRDMSVMMTPPQDRLAIQTHIIKYNEDIIASAVEKEIQREGQVFFVHNDIETLPYVKQRLVKLCPHAKIVSAHGRMHPKELENIMFDFVNYKYDVLVSTTIIENGIDIPRANTIIVNNADKFGLSQLYQLRGRVGRSSRRAYAYFIVSDESALTPLARKRLAALKEFSELGSGFRLAAMDLEIRGAGNLLGKQQHGHIVELGFETYCHLLNETAKKLLNLPIPPKLDTEISLELDSQIPKSYISSQNLRMLFYKKISSCQKVSDLIQIKNQMIDRFGKLPSQVENLFYLSQLKILSKEKAIKKIVQKDNKIYLSWHLIPQITENPNFIWQILKLVPNSSAQFLSNDTLVIPYKDAHFLLDFITKLPEANIEAANVSTHSPIN